MPAHISYPSIDQFRNLIRTIEQKYTYKQDATGEWVKDPLAVMPTLTFNASVKLHGCVSKDSLVLMSDNTTKKIKDIKQGDSVFSYNEKTCKKEQDIVHDVVIQDLDKGWLRIDFDNGKYIECTEDHPFLTTDGWVEAQNLHMDHVFIEA